MTKPRNPASGPVEPVGTAAEILDSAEQLVQRRGFNGFSYADVAAELGVTKASLHYHFPGKGDLGQALIERYARRFGDALGAIDATTNDPVAKLAAYVDLYGDVLRRGRMCLCGMLAAEYETLSEPIRLAVISFLDENETWLESVLEAGRASGAFFYAGSARDAARSIVASLEGAMLVARPYGDPARFQAAADRLVAGLAAR